MSNTDLYKVDIMNRFKNYIEKYKYLKSGDDFYEEGNYIGACNEYQRAIDLDPDFVDAHHSLGHSFFNLEKYDKAVDNFKRCTELDNNVKAFYYDWGNALIEIKHYEDAIKKFKRCIELDINDLDIYNNISWNIYSLNAIAYILNFQGMYEDARNYWKAAIKIYMQERQKAKDSRDIDFFSDYGDILCCRLGFLDQAKIIYEEGYELDSENINILADLIHLYAKIYEKDKFDTKYYWDSIEKYKIAKEILNLKLEDKKEQLSKYEIVEIFHILGYLSLEVEEYEDAEKALLRAFDMDETKSVEICIDLGILFLNKKDFKKAIEYFKKALRKDPDDLTIKNFLAYANLKEKLVDDAENIYKNILDVSPYNIDALIGLGDVYMEIGDNSENDDMYDESLKYFDKVIELKGSEKISKIITKKELAGIYYSRGYVKVALFNFSKNVSLLIGACNDFRNCLENDKYNHEAKRNKEKIDKELFFSSSIMEKIGVFIVLFFSLILLIITQLSFYKIIPIEMTADSTKITDYYAIFTFTFLVLIILVTHLHQIVKVKVAGIEIEKNPASITSRKFLRLKKLSHDR